MLSVKTFLQVAGAIFTIVGILHLLRLLTGFQVVFGTWVLPMWLSIFGVIFPWYLAYNAFTLAKKKNSKK
ncbi:MAG: hypothetical protein ACREBJ_04830 [Nitrosotalea sp.]